jgi:hypothetical protein
LAPVGTGARWLFSRCRCVCFLRGRGDLENQRTISLGSFENHFHADAQKVGRLETRAFRAVLKLLSGFGVNSGGGDLLH